MTSSWVPPGGELSTAEYRAQKKPADGTTQAVGDTELQWILMKDVDTASGYQTPSPPEKGPAYEGQVVLVPAAPSESRA